MTTENAGPTSLSRYWSLGSAYVVTVGVLYLWGYWPRFGINILEYLSLTDIIKLTAYPVASAFIFLAVGAVMGEILASEHPLPPGGGRNTWLGRFLNWAAPVLKILFLSGTFALWLYGPEEKWRILPVLVSLPLYIPVKRAGLLQELTHDSTRSVLVFLLCMAPLWSYGQGRLEAAHIRDGSKYKYIAQGTIDGVWMGDPADEKNRIKYLGHAGGYIFLLAPDNETVTIVELAKVNALHLKSHSTTTFGAST